MDSGAAARLIQTLIRDLRHKHTEHELLDKLRRTVKVVLDVELTDKQVDQSLQHIDQVMDDLARDTVMEPALQEALVQTTKRPRDEPSIASRMSKKMFLCVCEGQGEEHGASHMVELHEPSYASLLSAVASKFEGRSAEEIEYVIKVPDTCVADDEDVSLLEPGQKLMVHWVRP
eukprot:TRINITY_DN25672_c0_g1_i4.p1 TRINITY_DN25672_c0_g1~~TRINITY_DN25672_c0_g1_i4.p1  ORF type:complete len:174 (-),score=39.77 TRINITY_DN25672_c0_g1_i4:541-1062(-)